MTHMTSLPYFMDIMDLYSLPMIKAAGEEVPTVVWEVGYSI